MTYCSLIIRGDQGERLVSVDLEQKTLHLRAAAAVPGEHLLAGLPPRLVPG